MWIQGCPVLLLVEIFCFQVCFNLIHAPSDLRIGCGQVGECFQNSNARRTGRELEGVAWTTFEERNSDIL